MSLLTRKSDLKLLKYGQDRPGGGDSGQPYIQNNINNPKDILGFDDGLVRGGAVGAARASSKDSIRIGKWLKDFPKGPLWIVKQTGLQRSNPRLESPIIPSFPAEPTRYYNFGSNTLTQIPVNAFGIHFDRHGLLPIQSANTKYLAVAQANNKNFGANNRLIKLKSQLIGSNTSAPPSFVTKLLAKATTFLNNNLGLKLPTPGLTIYDYSGGPGSVYGLGRTLIKRYDNTTTGIANKIPIPSNDTRLSSNIENYQFATPISTAYGTSTNQNSINQNVIPYTSPSTAAQKYAQLKKVVDSNTTKSKKTIFTPVPNILKSNNISNYSTNNVEYKNGSATVKLPGNWRTLNRETRVGSGKTDNINLTPTLEKISAGTQPDKVKGFNINDLVKFRIQALNGDNPTQADWMIFRAYLTQFSDSTDAKWTPIQYAGRGEEFYTYTGFTRKIQIGFKVAALSAWEMFPMYQKLNYLMGNLMPDYSNGLMRGPLVKMTVGNWIDGQDGILNSLSYTVPNDAPWEIALGTVAGIEPLILPHIVEVQMQFTPIGSQTAGKNEISRKNLKINNIAQDYQRNIIGNITDTPPKISTPLAAINPNINAFEENFGPLGGLNLNPLSTPAINTNINTFEQNFGPTGG
jgi:hypothetical protein